MPWSTNRIEAFKLVDHAVRLQLTDDGDLIEIEKCFTKALELDPDSIEVLQEAAHFYDAVVPNAKMARKCAASCREKAAELTAEMGVILAQ